MYDEMSVPLTGEPRAERQRLVSRKSPELPGRRRHRRQVCQHGHGDNEGSHRSSTAGSLGGVVEDLKERVACRRLQYLLQIAHAKSEDDGHDPALTGMVVSLVALLTCSRVRYGTSRHHLFRIPLTIVVVIMLRGIFLPASWISSDI